MDACDTSFPASISTRAKNWVERRRGAQQLLVIISRASVYSRLVRSNKWRGRDMDQQEWKSFPCLEIIRGGLVLYAKDSPHSSAPEWFFSIEEVEWGTGGRGQITGVELGCSLKISRRLSNLIIYTMMMLSKLISTGTSAHSHVSLPRTHSLFCKICERGRGPVRWMDADSCQKMFVIELSTFFADNTKTVLSFTLLIQNFLSLFL